VFCPNFCHPRYPPQAGIVGVDPWLVEIKPCLRKGSMASAWRTGRFAE